jgi:hypothetical protein
MDTDWTENLTPAEAQAAIDALKAHKASPRGMLQSF